VIRLFRKKGKADLSSLLYGTQAYSLNEENVKKLETCWMELVNGRWSRLPTPEEAEDTEFRLRYANREILHITKINSLRNGTLG